MKKVTIITISLLIVTIFLFNTINTLAYNKETSINNQEKWSQDIGNGNLSSGFGTKSNMATRGIAIYKNELYIGTQNFRLNFLQFLNIKPFVRLAMFSYRVFDFLKVSTFVPYLINYVIPFHGFSSDGCELWKYNQTTDLWTPIVSNKEEALLSAGFENNNFATAVIQEFKNDLYIGTAASSFTGCEIWKYNGEILEKVASKGFDNTHNSGAWSIAVYQDHLYIGTMNWKQGCQIYRTNDGYNWTKMDIPGGDGFGNPMNVYAWDMGIYNNKLYVGTCNLDPNGAAQLWQYNGTQWKKMSLPGGDGFGEHANYGIRNIQEYQNKMMIGTGTSFLENKQGCELWTYEENNNTWECLVGDHGIIEDGFGNVNNKYLWSMTEKTDGTLWMGTLNIEPFVKKGPFNSTGCEIYTYDGETFKQQLGNQNLGGFGNPHNFGARSLIEYPENNGNIWVGTFTGDVTDFKDFQGCEIWHTKK